MVRLVNPQPGLGRVNVCEEPDGRDVTALDCQVEGRVPVKVLHIWVKVTALSQHRNNVCLFLVLASQHQARSTRLILGVHVTAMTHQETHDVRA